MARIAIAFGIMMILLGVGLYGAAVMHLNSEPASAAQPEARPAWVRGLTALIPAGFGLVLLVLGLIARNASDRTRMHVMHGAALVGLLGVALPLWRVIKALTADTPANALALGGNIALMVLSGIFLGLCVKSFIDSRVARKLREATTPGHG